MFFLAQAAARQMLAAGGGGRIINTASLLSHQGGINVASYTASKHAVAGLTRAMSNEWAPVGINVNAIAPGWIDTTGSDFTGADALQHPAGRVGKPADIVSAALFLCSEAASFITGQTLTVDGGMGKLMVYHGDAGWRLES